MLRIAPALLLPFLALLPITAATQRGSGLPPALVDMLDTEAHLAARTVAIGWILALAERTTPGQITMPDGRPVDEALAPVSWQPRIGDVAGSGDLGYTTGPVQFAGAGGATTSGVFVRVWTRQPGGPFTVARDALARTPRPAPFPEVFTRAGHADRFSGDYTERTPPLATADTLLNAGLRTGARRAYRTVLADHTRLVTDGRLPIVGSRDILAWVDRQPRIARVDSHGTLIARSGDMGCSWGTLAYATAARGQAAARTYLRIWTRARDGQWQLALAALTPVAVTTSPPVLK